RSLARVGDSRWGVGILAVLVGGGAIDGVAFVVSLRPVALRVGGRLVILVARGLGALAVGLLGPVTLGAALGRLGALLLVLVVLARPLTLGHRDVADRADLLAGLACEERPALVAEL